MDTHFDILIVGAGLIGSSVAMNLAKFSKVHGRASIAVIDVDLLGSLSSSELNAGGVRATWNQPINILASIDTIRYFQKNADLFGYRPCGYLWLKTPEQFEQNKKACKLQRELGWDVEEWGKQELIQKIPFIDKHNDLYGAYFGVKDGLINSNLLKLHFRNEALRAGVKFFDYTFLKSAKFNSLLKKWELSLDKIDYSKTERYLKFEDIEKPNSSQILTCSKVINCAGPWANLVAEKLGYKVPSFSLRRQISLFDVKGLDLSTYGMIIDTSGVYFHPEATYGLAGYCTRDEPSGINFTYDGEEFFQNFIWASLYERSTQFENLKHVTGWAGLYETSPDESAIIGEVLEVPKEQAKTVFEAHSFSGHGVMHSYSAGKAIAELIYLDRYENIDFMPLNGNRFKLGKLIHEGAVI